MFEFYIVSASGLILFIALPLLLKSNAVLMFLLLCAGELVAKQVSVEASKFVSSFITSSSLPIYSAVQISILLIAPMFILLAYKNTMQAKNIFFSITAGLAATIVFVYLVTAKLPYDINQKIENTHYYSTITAFVSVALVAGLVAATIYLIANKPHSLKVAKHDKS